MIETKPLTPKEYHALSFDIDKLPNLAAAGYISASVLSAVRDPIRMVFCQKEKTKEMSWGSLVDCLLTTPSQFASEYAVLPSDAPRDVRRDSRIINAKKPSQDSLDAIAWWNAFDKESGGRTCISVSDLEEAKAAVRMLRQNSTVESIMDCSMMQVAFVGDSPFIEGAKAKALLDMLPTSGEFGDAIVDLKTTGQMADSQLATTAFTFDYAVKLAYYGIMAEEAGFGPRPRGVLIWQNSSFPYEVKVREIKRSQMDAARLLLPWRHRKLSEINPCDMRPYFDTPIKEMELPDWAMNAYMRE